MIPNTSRSGLAYRWQSNIGSLVGVSLFIALWYWGSTHYGAFILPSPGDTAARLIDMTRDGTLSAALADSGRRALLGFLLALTIGTALGILSGAMRSVRYAIKPLVTALMGIPPVAWIVLALIWFGMGDGTPVFTVFISTFPLLFTNALAGMQTQDERLAAMCKVFGVSGRHRLFDLVLPHLAAYIFPAATIALASSWKVTIMAELLSASGGLGDRLAVTRNTLDTAGTLALMAAMTAILLCLQYALLEPLRRRLERWR